MFDYNLKPSGYSVTTSINTNYSAFCPCVPYDFYSSDGWFPCPSIKWLFFLMKTGFNDYRVQAETLFTGCIWTNKMHKILVIRLYFPFDALHVSDCISPSSGTTFISCTSHLVYAGICQYVWLLCGYSHTTARCIDIYQMRCTAYKSCSLRWTNTVRYM